MTGPAGWIAVEWGLTGGIAWAMTDSGGVLDEARSTRGACEMGSGEFEAELLGMVGDWLGEAPTDVLACGLVAPQHAWAAAPLTAVPAAPAAVGVAEVPLSDPRLRLRFLGGMKLLRPADVMRSGVARVAGVLAHRPGFDGTICLPGPRTRWVHVAAGEVVSFQSTMTAELAGLLAERSVLRHSIGAGWDADAFAAALADTLARPETLAARLFSIRAAGLLAPDGGTDDGARARAALWGTLIGADLAAARPYWLGRPVIVAGEAAVSGPYRDALALQGLAPEILDGNAMARSGLAALHARTGAGPDAGGAP